MSYFDIGSEHFWSEVNLRARNNYDPYGTSEEVEVNISRAIGDITQEAKEAGEKLMTSKKAVELQADIMIDAGIMKDYL